MNMKAALMALTFATGAAMAQPDLRTLLDERAIILAADSIDAAVDAKDWPLARSLFADRVRVDFSSLGAGPPATIPADDLIGAWRTNLWEGKTSLHLRTNHRVRLEGNRATLDSHGYAWNAIGDRVWEVWGTYRHTLARTESGWQVDGFTFTRTLDRGDRAVPGAPRP